MRVFLDPAHSGLPATSVLFNKNVIRCNMKKIQSKLNRIGTYVSKIYLSCFDDKIHILDGGINSLAYIHKVVKSQ